MRPSKARFVTLCQQALAVGVVIAMLGPAADVVSLDVVVRPGADARQTSADPELPGPAAERARVATEAVAPEVTEVPLETGRPADAPAIEAPADGAHGHAGHGHAARGLSARGAVEFVTEPQPVDGLATIGVTWESGQTLEEDQISVMARTRTDGKWSDWTEVEYHDEHQPDPDSAEGRSSRPGTEPLVVGEVDEVQTRVVTARGAQADQLSMAVIEPGSGDSARQAPAIDTEAVDEPAGAVDGGAADEAVLQSSAGDLALSTSSFTRKPRIYSRAQWGADESLRDRSSLRYYEVHAGFVHHTVNANKYSADQVPGIIRGIYAYHTRSRGWSDIGYNFLVDRFGRVWEGRYGGVDRPVVGAHTSGYNEYSFAASAIGNFEEVRPSSEVVAAYGRLMAWKLALHGVDATSTSQRVGSRTLPAINGHRDAGSTACPGRYLYAQIPAIRNIAADTQSDWSGRDRQTSIVRDEYPDLVLRRKRNGRAVIVPTGGMLSVMPRQLYRNWSWFDVVEPSPDLTGDGRADVLTRVARTGRVGVRPGNGAGRFGRRIALTYAFAGFDQITATGDLDGDGRNDMVGRHVDTGRLHLFAGNGKGGFSRSLLAAAWPYEMTVATGDLTRDGKADLLGRDSAGVLWLHRGTGARSLAEPTRVPGRHWGRWQDITGYGDFTADGAADLLVRNSRGKGFVFPGNGRGGFRHWVGPLNAVGGLKHLSAVDIDGGGDADVLGLRRGAFVARDHTGRQNVHRAIATGTSFAGANLVLNVGDFDRDGPADVVVRETDGDLVLHRGVSTGGFAPGVRIATGFQNVRLLAAAGDVTGDGYPDLMGQPGTGAMRIYPGRGSRLKPSYVAHSALSASRQVGLGRWNGDGAPDSGFVADGKLTWMKGNGPGGLTGSRYSVPGGNLSRYSWVLSVGDVDGRNGPDLVVRQRKLLWLLPSNGKGGFEPRRYLAAGMGGFDLAG